MGSQQSKPYKKLQCIDKKVSSIRSSIRGFKRNIPKKVQDKIVLNLASYSSQANALRGKVNDRQLNVTQKKISDTINEILMTNTRESQLDQGALETTSFIQMPLTNRHSTARTTIKSPPKKQKSSQNALMKQNAFTLDDIEYKFKGLNSLISIAIDNKLSTQLQVYKETIKVLTTDLKMIDIAENTHLNDRKEKLISTLTFKYQKLNNTIKKLQRNRDINYLSSQFEKEQVVEELDEIKSNLEETTKKGSHSDLTKAQSNYDDLINNIASGQNRDKKYIKIKFQSLQSYISNIKDEGEEKRQLLNKIHESFSSLVENHQAQNQTSDKTDIAEHRKTIVINIVMETEDFESAWERLQTTLQAVKLSKDVHTVDKILEQIHISIGHMRNTILSKSKTKLSKNFSNSTPNLSSAKLVQTKFGSSLSVDNSNGSLIKTKAKAYNLGIPQVKTANSKPVVLAKKQLKMLEQKATKDQSFRRTLSTTHKTLESEKLAKLRLEVDTIRNNIKTTPSSGINLFHDLKTRLDVVSLGLDQIHNLDDDVMQQKSVLGNEVKTLKNVVEGKISVAIHYNLKSPAKEDALRNAEVQLNKLKTEIETFVGTKSDNKFYELDEYSIRLILRLDDMETPKGSSAHEKKIELLKQISQCGDILKKRAQETESLIKYERDINDIEINFEKSTNLPKLADRVSELKTNLLSSEFNTLLTGRKQSCIKKLDAIVSKISEKDDSENILELQNEINTIKTGIEEFSGIHTDRKYYELESSSKSLHSKLENFQLPTGTKLYERKHALLNEMESYGILLDKKAKETEILTKFEHDVNDIEIKHTNLSNDVLKFAERASDLKTKLQSNTSLSSRKQICLKTLDDIMNKITEIINNTKNSEKLLKLEKEFDTVKIGIDEFSGINTDRKFYELDESITFLFFQLGDFQFPPGTKLYERKYALLKEMHSYSKILDRKAKETEAFREIVNKIDEIHSRLVKSKDDKDKLKIIEAELKSVKSKIGNYNLSENLKKAVGQEYVTIMERFLPLQKAVEASKSNYIGSDALLADLDKNKSKAPEKNQNNLESQVNEIEKELSELKENIASCTNTEDSEEYQYLKDAIHKANVKLKQLDVPKEDHVLFTKKSDLKQIALDDYLTDLDKKVQVEDIIDIEKKLENNGKKFGAAMNEEDINALDEELISLYVKMGKISIST